MAEIFHRLRFGGKLTGHAGADQKGDVERKIADSEPVSLFVFKTVADPFAGRINYFKVMSGVLKNDATLTNFNRSSQERFQHVQVMEGKTATAVNELHTGDIGAIAKLKETVTGDTLGDKNAPIFYSPARIPEPSITFAIEPKTRADEDRIGVAIHKILEEDLALRSGRRPANEGIPAFGRGAAAHRSGCCETEEAVSRGIDAASLGFPTARPFAARRTPKANTKKQTGGHETVWPVPHQDGATATREGNRVRGRCIWRRGHFRRTGFRRLKRRRSRIGKERGFLASFPVV